MRISVFGLGYVGSVSAACLAAAGHEVIGVDVNPDKVALINRGQAPVIEPGLPTLLARAVRAGRLRATADGAAAVAASELALICIGTPGLANGRPDLEALRRVCAGIGAALAGRTGAFTVVVRSTVLPGTTAEVVLPALRAGAGANPHLEVAVNPEFMREGSALRDFAAPPFLLVGAASATAAARVRAMYAQVEAEFVHTAVETAEMVKFASNAFHALKVCFANEMGDLSSALGADPQQVMRVFRMDRKLNVSDAYLRPGFAFGGSCLPKDLRALLYAARNADLEVPLLARVLPANQARVQQAVDAVVATHCRRIGVVGLSFKPGTDDLRESPMVELVERLLGKGCEVRVLDRNVALARLTGANRRYIEEEIPHIASLLCSGVAQLLEHAELLIVGSAGADAKRVLEAAGPNRMLLDLTTGVMQVCSPARAEGRTTWTTSTAPAAQASASPRS
jgi:GDP-mannose 6-dehydrogenase